MRLPLRHTEEEALASMRDVLQENFLTLRIARYALEEDLDASRCRVRCTVIESPGPREVALEGEGVGMVDALFSGLRARYAQEHHSLDSIRFSSFSVRGLLSESHNNHASDGHAEAVIGITNSHGTEFEFGARTKSVTHSCVEVVVAAVEYFVNSERAWVATWRALEHYRSTGRHDLVPKYTDLLSQLVRNTSYSSVIERLSRKS